MGQGFLLAGGTKGKRIALKNAEIMIHQPAIHGNGVQGQATEHDNYMSSEEALEFGLIDKIIEHRI